MLTLLVFEHIRTSMWCGVKLGHKLEHERGPRFMGQGGLYIHVQGKVKVTQGFHIFWGCLRKKVGTVPKKFPQPSALWLGGFATFLVTYTKRLAMLLLGAVLVTVYVSVLGGIICCLHF